MFSAFRILATVGCSALLVSWTTAAIAADSVDLENNRAAAQSLFEAGVKLLQQKRVDEACPKFAESVRLYPSVGGSLNLGRCHERKGKTASAWTEYSRAAGLAKARNDSRREAIARDLATKLAPKLSKLTIVISESLEGLQVKRNGTLVGSASFGVSVAVDPGPQLIEASAPGRHTWSHKITIPPGPGRQSVTIPPLELAPDPPPPPPDDESKGPNFSGMHIGALLSGGVGLAGIIVGSVFGMKASSTWDEAQEAKLGPNTPGANELSNDALDQATISTVGFVVGGIGAAAGITLWILAPSLYADDEAPTSTEQARPGTWNGLRVLPAVSDNSALVVVTGRF